MLRTVGAGLICFFILAFFSAQAQKSLVSRGLRPAARFERVNSFKELREQAQAVKTLVSSELDKYLTSQKSITDGELEDLIFLLQLETIQVSLAANKADVTRMTENWERFWKKFSAGKVMTSLLPKKIYSILDRVRMQTNQVIWRDFLFTYFNNIPTKVIDSSFSLLVFEKCSKHHFWNQYTETAKCVQFLNKLDLKYLDNKAKAFVKFYECSAYFEMGDLVKLEEFKKKYTLSGATDLLTNATFISLLKGEVELKYREGWKKLNELIGPSSLLKPQSTDYSTVLLRRLMYLAETKNFKLIEPEINRINKAGLIKSGSQQHIKLMIFKSLALIENKKTSEAYGALPEPNEWKSYRNIDDFLFHATLKCVLARNMKINTTACSKVVEVLPLLKGVIRDQWLSQAIQSIAESAVTIKLTSEQSRRLNQLVSESEKNRESAVVKVAARLLLGTL